MRSIVNNEEGGFAPGVTAEMSLREYRVVRKALKVYADEAIDPRERDMANRMQALIGIDLKQGKA